MLIACSIVWSKAELIIQVMTAGHLGHEVAKQPQTFTVPPPGLNVRIIFFFLKGVLLSPSLYFFYTSYNGLHIF